MGRRTKWNTSEQKTGNEVATKETPVKEELTEEGEETTLVEVTGEEATVPATKEDTVEGSEKTEGETETGENETNEDKSETGTGEDKTETKPEESNGAATDGINGHKGEKHEENCGIIAGAIKKYKGALTATPFPGISVVVREKYLLSLALDGQLQEPETALKALQDFVAAFNDEGISQLEIMSYSTQWMWAQGLQNKLHMFSTLAEAIAASELDGVDVVGTCSGIGLSEEVTGTINEFLM